MKKKRENKMVMNTTMLFLMNVAKLVFPLLTLPYLTRVLSVECYGVVAYVKSIMTYVQVFVDFGFVLSTTKEIVENQNNKETICKITGNALIAKLILAGISTVALGIMGFGMPILNGYFLYLMASQISVYLSCFFLEYFFRGIEMMHIITIRFVLMKSISTVLTFFLVKSDQDVLWIPILDVISYSIAAILSVKQVYSFGYKIKFEGLKYSFKALKTSFFYFLSNMASTAFNILNTLLIGIFATSSDVAYWSVCLQLITAVQSIYPSISDGIYPEMVKTKNFGIIKKTLKIFVPIVICGCLFTIAISPQILLIVGGRNYVSATSILRFLTPVLFFSFFTYMLGWPALGAINKVNQTTKTTVFSALFQIAGLFILVLTNRFTIINIAILRSITEAVLAFMRGRYCYIYKKEFRS